MPNQPDLQFGDFTLNVGERLLSRDGLPVALTPKAFDLLAALVTRAGRLVTKDELLKEVWPDSFVEESNLAYHVFAIRRALGEAADGERFIETVPKRGYRFVGPMTPSANGSDERQPAAAPDTRPRAAAVNGHPHPISRQGATDGSQYPAPGLGADRPDRLVGRPAVLWFLGGVCCAALALWLLYPRPSPRQSEPMEVEVSTAVTLTDTSAFAYSPDGRHLVFAGSGADGVVRLWVRSMRVNVDRPLPGTEVALGAPMPPMFWSPDSRFVAFDALGRLKKIDVNGGLPQTVCTLQGLAVGGSWSRDDVILVGNPSGGIVRCPAAGGAAAIVTEPERSRPGDLHLFPWFLPDGRHFLYLSISRTAPEHSGLYVHSLDAPATSSPSRVLDVAFGSAYVPGRAGASDHLVFVREGSLFAQPFDLARLRVTGAATRIAGPVGHYLDGAFFSASESGALAFRGPTDIRRLTWLNRQGHVVGHVGEAGRYEGMALAPSERHVVVVKNTGRQMPDQELWRFDLPSGMPSRFTFDSRLEDAPVWSNDSSRVLFTENGRFGSVYEQSLQGEPGARARLGETQAHKIPTSVSADGRFLLFTNQTAGPTRSDVWVLPLTDDTPPYALVRRPLEQEQAQFSPDDRWVAYVSNESGLPEVMLRPFASAEATASEGSGQAVQISSGGGTAPRWSRDGRELFFVAPGGFVVAVPINGTDGHAGPHVTLFRVRGMADWDVSAEGRFLVMAPEDGASATSFSVMLDWPGTLDPR